MKKFIILIILLFSFLFVSQYHFIVSKDYSISSSSETVEYSKVAQIDGKEEVTISRPNGEKLVGRLEPMKFVTLFEDGSKAKVKKYELVVTVISGKINPKIYTVVFNRYEVLGQKNFSRKDVKSIMKSLRPNSLFESVSNDYLHKIAKDNRCYLSNYIRR